MTLYLKYRPQDLDEIDITSVRESLKKIIESGNIPHAFLFSGPKGTGKTSTARILAKILNCKGTSSRLRAPCGKCAQCISITNGSNLDVIELDAASNRGIDDIRTLREGIKLAPISAKKKIYIIDEAHMLTTEASNALLKTLEEPPSHVVFILATTNPEKLIGTIHSRVTKVNFTKATNEEIVRSLSRVVKGEGVKVKQDDLLKITELANGSFRDAVKNLEAFLLEGEKYLQKDLDDLVNNFIKFLYEKDREKLLNIVSDLVNNGASIENFIKGVLTKLRDDLLNVSAKSGVIELLELLIEVPEKMKSSPIEELPLEIAIVKYTIRNQESGNRKQWEEVTSFEPSVIGNIVKQSQTKIAASPTAPRNDTRLIKLSSVKLDDIKWKEILAKVKPINASIEALLRSSRPIDFDGRVLKLGVFYKFHKERLEDIKNRKILEDIAGELLGNPIRINCLLTEPPVGEIKKQELSLTENKDRDIIEVAQQIFGT